MTSQLTCVADVRFPIERANGIQTMETCAALARRGWDVRLVVRPDTFEPARDPFAYYGVAPDPRLAIGHVRVSGPPSFRRAMFLLGALARTRPARRSHIVFTRDLGFASLFLGTRGAGGAALVYESHGFAPAVSASRPDMLTGAARAKSGKWARLARREAFVWRRAEGYATITRGLADELVERFGPRPALAVVPDGARVEAADPPPRLAVSPAPVLGYSGHLYPWKGADVLLDAVAELPGVRGLIVGGHPGEADLERLRQRADRLGISSRVEFTGMVAPREVASRLEAADVLVLPNPATAVSERYTSPLKLFEYLAMGRPIVASDLPAIREVLRDGENAVLFEPGRASALADAVRSVLRDPALAGSLARRARETAREYSWDRRAERLDALFAEASARRGR